MQENQNGETPLSKVSVESYKGVRDFYPEDMFIQNYIFDTWKKTAESYGYVEYGASVLEPAELYRAKTGEEIVSEQTYTFTDRGGREVTLRPEMTPTAARLVAAKYKELSFPLRWFSIPNLFRYERPQKGRLREHWQLNADIFGVAGLEGDIEIISLAYHVMKAFGANDQDFIIKIGSRNALEAELVRRKISVEKHREISRLIDKKGKMPEEERKQKLAELGGGFEISESEDVKEIRRQLEYIGIKNAAFDPEIVRGFDYYTGIVFEIFDTNPENNRSLFGGGRYDRLLEIFGAEKIPAVGFGMGDVTIREFMESRGLLPKYRSPVDIYVATTDDKLKNEAQRLASELRAEKLNSIVDLSDKKLGDQLKRAEKEGAPFSLVVGENELASETFKVKDMEARAETQVKRGEIANYIKERRK